MSNTYNYDFINRYNASRNPSTVHSAENATAWYFRRYLIQKIISVFEFKGIPAPFRGLGGDRGNKDDRRMMALRPLKHLFLGY